MPPQYTPAKRTRKGFRNSLRGLDLAELRQRLAALREGMGEAEEVDPRLAVLQRRIAYAQKPGIRQRMQDKGVDLNLLRSLASGDREMTPELKVTAQQIRAKRDRMLGLKGRNRAQAVSDTPGVQVAPDVMATAPAPARPVIANEMGYRPPNRHMPRHGNLPNQEIRNRLLNNRRRRTPRQASGGLGPRQFYQ